MNTLRRWQWHFEFYWRGWRKPEPQPRPEYPDIEVIFVKSDGRTFLRRVPYMGQRWITVPIAPRMEDVMNYFPGGPAPRFDERKYEIENATFREVAPMNGEPR